MIDNVYWCHAFDLPKKAKQRMRRLDECYVVLKLLQVKFNKSPSSDLDLVYDTCYPIWTIYNKKIIACR